MLNGNENRFGTVSIVGYVTQFVILRNKIDRPEMKIYHYSLSTTKAKPVFGNLIWSYFSLLLFLLSPCASKLVLQKNLSHSSSLNALQRKKNIGRQTKFFFGVIPSTTFLLDLSLFFTCKVLGFLFMCNNLSVVCCSKER